MMSVLGQRRRLAALSALLCACGACAVAAFGVAGTVRAALPGMDEIVFKVFRDGAPLGRHRVAFRREADALHVEIDILLEVKLAFLTVFRYRHTNREVWRDGRLAAINTETDDDGARFWLRGRASAAGLVVEGSSGRFVAPADIMPTSYWNAETVSEDRLLDTQRGRLIDVRIAPAGAEAVVMNGRPVSAERYSVTGDLTLDLWYAADGQWAKTRFEARGAEVVYARHDDGEAASSAEGAASRQ